MPSHPRHQYQHHDATPGETAEPAALRQRCTTASRPAIRWPPPPRSAPGRWTRPN